MKRTRNWVVACAATSVLMGAMLRAANPPTPAVTSPAAAAKTKLATKPPTATASPAVQNASSASPAAAGENLDRDDRRFLQSVAASEQTDVALAQLAADRTEDPRIRRFAEDLGRDHTALDLEAAALAQARNIPVENDLMGDRTYRSLAQRKLTQFDAKFLDTIIERRQRDIAHFEAESRLAKDPAIRDFASAHLGALRQQLATAQSLE